MVAWESIVVLPSSLEYLEGCKLCVVLIKADEDDPEGGGIKLKCLHGRANVSNGRLYLEGAGPRFEVPSGLHHNILPNDGTKMLKDAEFFVMCRVAGMDL